MSSTAMRGCGHWDLMRQWLNNILCTALHCTALWRTLRLRTAGDVADVLRIASRAAISGLPLLLR